ncbi:MAG: protein kinase [Lachnospiraceae bacterium]|nr:protein kinase [Lachnospiraceae bacterium]
MNKTEYMPVPEGGKTEYMPAREAGRTEYMPVSAPESAASSSVKEKKQQTVIRRIKAGKHLYSIQQAGVNNGRNVYRAVDETGNIFGIIEYLRSKDSDIYLVKDMQGVTRVLKRYRRDYENKGVFDAVGAYLQRSRNPGVSRLQEFGEMQEIDELGNPSSTARWYFVFPQYKPIRQRPDDTTFVKWVGILNEALHEIHTDGNLVHRDIKPENIMLDPATDLPVIIDFDAAALLDQKAGGLDYAETNGAFLTPQYAPPETRNESSGYAEPASDYFSFGVTLTEIYSGMNLLRQSLFKDARDLNRQVLYDEITFPASVETNPNVLNLVKALMCYKSRERAGYEEVVSWLSDPGTFVHQKYRSPIMGFHYEIGDRQFDSPEALAVYFSTNNYDCILQWENGGLFRYAEKIRDDYKPLYDGLFEIKREYENKSREQGAPEGRELQPWQKAFVYAIIRVLDPYADFAWDDVIYPYDQIRNASDAIVKDVLSSGHQFDALFENDIVFRYRLRLGQDASDRKLRDHLNDISGFAETEMKKLLYAEALSPGTLVRILGKGKFNSVKAFVTQYMMTLRKDIVNGGIDSAMQCFYADGKPRSAFASFVQFCNHTYVFDALFVCGGYGEGYRKLLAPKNKGQILMKDIFRAITVVAAFCEDRAAFANEVLSSGQGILGYFLWHIRKSEHNGLFVGYGELACQNLNQIHEAENTYNKIVYERKSPAMWRTLGEFFTNLKDRLDIFYDFLVFDDARKKAYLDQTVPKDNYIICIKDGIMIYRFFDSFRIVSLAQEALGENGKGLCIESEPVAYADDDILQGTQQESTEGQPEEPDDWNKEDCTAYDIAMYMIPLFQKQKPVSQEPLSAPQESHPEPAGSKPPLRSAQDSFSSSSSAHPTSPKKKRKNKVIWILVGIFVAFGIVSGIKEKIAEEKAADQATGQILYEGEAAETQMSDAEPNEDREDSYSAKNTPMIDFSKYYVSEESFLETYRDHLRNEVAPNVENGNYYKIVYGERNESDGWIAYDIISEEGNAHIGQIGFQKDTDGSIQTVTMLSDTTALPTILISLLRPNTPMDRIVSFVKDLGPDDPNVGFVHYDSLYYRMTYHENAGTYVTIITINQAYLGN